MYHCLYHPASPRRANSLEHGARQKSAQSLTLFSLPDSPALAQQKRAIFHARRPIEARPVSTRPIVPPDVPANAADRRPRRRGAASIRRPSEIFTRIGKRQASTRDPFGLPVEVGEPMKKSICSKRHRFVRKHLSTEGALLPVCSFLLQILVHQ